MHKKQAISMVSSSLAGAKTARACDGCVGKKAGWYCPADDAFLCQNCDRSVHSANSLAGRHQRVRLECSSRPSSWDCGFTRKARTPRNRKKNSKDCPTLIKEFIHDSYSADVKHALHLVPEVYSISDEEKEEEEELLYCVPILDPSVAEMCSSGGGANFPASRECHYEEGSEVIRPSEFATEVVESLLGIGFEEEEPMGTVEVLGLLSNFSQGNHKNVGGDEGGDVVANDDFGSENGRKKTLLKLDYEGVITAWADQRSPWSNGERPDLDLNDCWLDLTGEGRRRDGYGEMGGGLMEEGRKARVWRYREKRRKRLFSKRIRYQVRKLNAEKRPRMKGRFVKRPNCVPPPPLSFPLQIS